jgi:hypothetical protein
VVPQHIRISAHNHDVSERMPDDGGRSRCRVDNRSRTPTETAPGRSSILAGLPLSVEALHAHGLRGRPLSHAGCPGCPTAPVPGQPAAALGSAPATVRAATTVTHRLPDRIAYTPPVHARGARRRGAAVVISAERTMVSR